MRFVCFSGAAVAVADEEVAAAAGARHRSGRRRGSLSSSLRSRFLSSVGKGRKTSAAGAKRASPDGRELVDDGCYDVAASASVQSSSAVSSSLSLDSACSSSSSTTKTSCSGSLSSTALDHPPHAARRQERRMRSPAAAGPAAVLVCLVMVMLCGRFGATVLASLTFYLFPRRWPATTTAPEAESAVVHEAPSRVHDVPSATVRETMKRKVVMDGFLLRNREM
ncbi:hypothetical protein ABZP36_000280 [Zizania latifolia]